MVIEKAAIAVDPFGSERFGLAVLSGKAKGGDAKDDAKVSDASLLATDRVVASRQSLSQLAEAVKPAPRPDMAIGSVSLDQMVQDMVRPMLKEWLDAHLPEIVERMVSREISRITDRNY